jgi:hypothetical protein
MSPVATDRVSVLRCRRSLALAVGCCCCCHRCCQPAAGRPVASRPALCRGWPASGPGRLPPGPCLLTGVSAETPGSSVTSRDVRSPGHFHLCSCPAVTVTLEAGGADTYTQRAIPGSEPSQDSCTSPSVVTPTPPCLTRGAEVSPHGFHRQDGASRRWRACADSDATCWLRPRRRAAVKPCARTQTLPPCGSWLRRNSGASVRACSRWAMRRATLASQVPGVSYAVR